MKYELAIITCIGILVVGILSGCRGKKATSMVNMLTLDTGDFQSILIDYDADDIHVFESDDDKLIVKEYMNENRKSYFARTITRSGELLITEGERPSRSSFVSYIEIYIARSYSANLSLHSTSGTIRSEIDLNTLRNFSVDTTYGAIHLSNTKAPNLIVTSTNGKIRLENIIADAIEIQTTNAITTMDQVHGAVNYQSKGGELTASHIFGSGSFDASGDGSIEISFTDVTNDIYAFSKNGALVCKVPHKLEFKFSASTKNGSITTDFPDQLTRMNENAAGIIGSSPTISIKLETHNGDIQVSR